MLIIGSLAAELGQAARMAMARGARIEQADGIEPGLMRLRADARIEIVLCDIALDVAGLIRGLRAERISVAVVACGTGHDADAAVRAIRDGARDFLPLPPDADLIAAILEAASGDAHALVAHDPAMRAAIRRAEQVAAAEASILISGESGTGKEVMARHIHRRSRRAAGPYVALNCAAIPENLLESELFGHEKGAFSGAVARRVGRFEAADGGTLLLDEDQRDGRAPAGQAAARVLQEREIDRLGGASPVKVNVRILATTNRDLAAEVAAGRFREDLFFRLNVVALRVPPLRDRPGDIPRLAAHFAEKYAALNGVPARPISAAAHARLAAHRLARQRARTGEHRTSRGAARRRRRDRCRCGRTRSVRRGGRAAARHRGLCGQAHGRGGAGPHHRHARAHARQPHARGDHPGHLDPGAAQQTA